MDVLGCPHCDRVFRVRLAVLGKTIRCRGCRGMFHVPRDTSAVPAAKPAHAAGREDSGGLPVAIASVVDGRAVRSCPVCGRTFAMQPKFAGKSIRCRGCRDSFYVAAESSSAEAISPGRNNASNGEAVVAVPQTPPPVRSPDSPEPPPRVEPPAEPVSDDIGDIVDDPPLGEDVPSVVRPESIHVRRSTTRGMTELTAVILGGVCALPVTQLILWWCFHKDPLQIVSRLPQGVRWIAPEHLDETP